MKKFAIVAALALLVIAYFVFDLGQYLTLEGIKAVAADLAAFQRISSRQELTRQG